MLERRSTGMQRLKPHTSSHYREAPKPEYKSSNCESLRGKWGVNSHGHGIGRHFLGKALRKTIETDKKIMDSIRNKCFVQYKLI